MKKSTLFLACCIGLMLFASCKKDPVAPTIDIYAAEGCVTENAQVYSGDTILVGFTGTGENLTQIEIVISQNGTVLASHSDNLRMLQNDPVTPFTYTHAFVVEASGTVTVKGTLTDANGLTASKSFNIIYNVKPNAKFVGRYEGNALATGTMDVNIVGMEPIHQEITNREIPVIMELQEGANINEVVGTCTFEDRVIDCKGTVVDDVVTFEAINDVMTFPYDLGGFTISPELNLTYNIKGVLNGNKLMLDGNGTGNGNINLFIYNGTVDVDITAVGGELDKQ